MLMKIYLFMFYKQHISADFEVRKDSAIGRGKQTVYRSVHVHGAVTQAPLRLRLAQIGAQFVKHKYTWEC